MPHIDDLIRRSSVGQGLSWSEFGRSVRDKRLSFRLSVAHVARLSGLAGSRVLEIEAGAPPFAREKELDAIARALGVDPSSLSSGRPR